MEPTVEKSTRNKIVLWIVVAIIIIGMVSITTLALLLLNKDIIHSQVYIKATDVSNLTKQEATEKIKNIYSNELEKSKINLVYENYSRQLAYKDIGYTYLYDQAVEEAYNVGREGNIVKRILNILKSRKNPVFINLQPHFEEKLLEANIEDVGAHINKEPKDAIILRQNGNFHITKEELGIKIEKALLLERITERLESFSGEDIIIPVVNITPRVTEEDLKSIQEVVGEFNTTFNKQMVGRSKNIAIAASSINSTLIMPGEEFSFNQRTGPTGVSEGYQEAPVIIGGELVPGIGGGVCQVSTTLYNAVVRSNLEVISRRNHTLTVGYVPLGHDAAVSYNNLDLQFRNNLQNPIYIESFVNGNKIYVRIYGKKEDSVTIGLVSEVIEVIEPNIETIVDENMFIGETEVEREPKKGYRVNTYKVYLENGKEIKREHISKDYYAPVHGKIIEGTKPIPIADAEVPVEDNQSPVEKDPLKIEEDPIELQDI